MDHLHSISAQGLEPVQPNATYYPSHPKAVSKGGKKGVIQTLGFLNNFLLELWGPAVF